MKYFLITLIFLQTFLLSCKTNIDKDFSMLKIEELKSKKVFNPPATVWKWVYKNIIYYYVTSDCCDQYTELYDEKGNLICHPDGGKTGRGDGKCPFDAFFANEKEVEKKLIWKDDRK